MDVEDLDDEVSSELWLLRCEYAAEVRNNNRRKLNLLRTLVTSSYLKSVGHVEHLEQLEKHVVDVYNEKGWNSFVEPKSSKRRSRGRGDTKAQLAIQQRLIQLRRRFWFFFFLIAGNCNMIFFSRAFI